jgi:hypothetical protein
MKEKSRSYAKGFAGMGFLYSGTECMIERYRAKHDSLNATLAGCATGGLMAAPGAAEVAVRCAVLYAPGCVSSQVDSAVCVHVAEEGVFDTTFLQLLRVCSGVASAVSSSMLSHKLWWDFVCRQACSTVRTQGWLCFLVLCCAGGAKAMCFGCASFAAFSTAIEYFTGGM